MVLPTDEEPSPALEPPCVSMDESQMSSVLSSQEELQDNISESENEPPPVEDTTPNDASDEDEQTEVFLCPKCNKDLTEQTSHNRNVHIKWCKIKAAKKNVKKRPSKEAAAFSSY